MKKLILTLVLLFASTLAYAGSAINITSDIVDEVVEQVSKTSQ